MSIHLKGVGSVCRGFLTVFDQAEKIDDDLLVDFADLSMDLGLHSIEGLKFLAPCLLQRSPVVPNRPQV